MDKTTQNDKKKVDQQMNTHNLINEKKKKKKVRMQYKIKTCLSSTKDRLHGKSNEQKI